MKYLLWLPGGSDGEESACCIGDPGLAPGSGRAPEEGHGYPLQHSCLMNSMDRRAWQAAVHGAAKSWTRLSNLTFTFHSDIDLQFVFLVVSLSGFGIFVM